MSATPESQSDDEKRAKERRRLIDLTRREKGLPERRDLGTDRRAASPRKRPAQPPSDGAAGGTEADAGIDED